ncbi:MAG TPA: hypothetical protein VGG70_04930 [Candidatus Cybelea sp.]|jgi:hypothetical protein
MMQIAAVLLLSGLIAQASPSGPPTAMFTSFITDVLAGRVPSNISETMRSQSEGLTQVRDAFAKFGTFKRLQYVREDNLQGYHRYHYSAVFTKSTQHVVFVTDSNGTIVGFFEDQPPQQQSQGQPPQQQSQGQPPPPGEPTPPPAQSR